MTSLKSIIKGDYLQRTRSFVFLITLLASVCMAYTFVPLTSANYSTVRVGDYVGLANAAWIAHVTAIMASTFLWLIGFYLVSNGIAKDKETGVGQIVAATSITNFKYLFSKALSNFFVLLTIAVIVMIMALSLVILRGHEYAFSPVQFILPYLLSTVPTIFCIAVFAVFFEVLFGKWTNLKNIAYFFLFPLIIGTTMVSDNPDIYWFDILGTKFLTMQMAEFVKATYHPANVMVSSGFLIGTKNTTHYFLFEGTHFTFNYVLSRMLWICFSFLLLKISALIFNRFDVREPLRISKNKIVTAQLETKTPLKEIHVALIPVAQPDFSIWSLIKTELLMILRTGPKWFWLINIGGAVALFFIPLTQAHQIGLPVLWFLQINRWADIATKEKYFGIHYFAFASFKPLQRLLTSQIISGILLATTLAIPLLIRYVILGDLLPAVSIFLGAIMVVAFAVFSGVVSGGKRFFEVVFFMVTYLNVSSATALDYFGGFNQGLAYNALLMLIIGMLLIATFVFRNHEIKNQ